MRINVFLVICFLSMVSTLGKSLSYIKVPENNSVHYENESISIVTYNILADQYSKIHYLNPFKIGDLSFSKRSQKVISKLKSSQADVLCLQVKEVDHYEEFYHEELESIGYACIYSKLGNKKKDGLVIAYNQTKLQPLEDPIVLDYDSEIEYKGQNFKTGKRALIAKFQIKQTLKQIIVVDTHFVRASSNFVERYAQICYLLFTLQKIYNDTQKNSSSKIGIVICGDFNCPPSSNEIRKFNNEPPKDDFNWIQRKKKKALKYFSEEYTHSLNLKSAYRFHNNPNLSLNSSYEDQLKNHPYTFSAELFTDTLDYIFHNDCLYPKKLLKLPIKKSEIEWGPNENEPSDHLMLGATFISV